MGETKPGERFIKRVTIDITTKCNLRCIMCSSWRETDNHDMPIELYKKIAIEVFPHTHELFFSCAYEALMSEYFINILEFTEQFNIPETVLISNGLLLNQENIVAVVKSKLNTLLISIDGATKQTYERIRRGGNFELLISNIEKLNKIKAGLHSDSPKIIFTAALMKSNLKELIQLIHLARRLSIKKINFKPMKIDVKEMEKESLLDSKDLVARFIDRAHQVAEEEDIDIGIAPEISTYLGGGGKDNRNEEESGGKHIQKKCIEPFPSMYILPDGKALPCTIWQEKPMGDFREQSFKDIWEENEYSALRDGLASGNFRQGCERCYYMCC